MTKILKKTLKRTAIFGFTIAALMLASLAIPAANADFLDCEGIYHPGSQQESHCALMNQPNLENMVVMCHNEKTVFVDRSWVRHHLNHGDKRESCNQTGPSSPPNSTPDDTPVTQKVRICHIPEDNTAGARTIVIDKAALEEHLAHGDHKGYCTGNEGDNHNDDHDHDYDNGHNNGDRPPRLYCVRDMCYIVYEECDDRNHCEKEVKKVPRDEFFAGKHTGSQVQTNNQEVTVNVNTDNRRPNRNYDEMPNNWNDWYGYMERYVNHRYYPQYACGWGHRNCTYRGFFFGGYQNGYWYY